MGENSAIEWTDHTFNPWRGCARVSPGCEHCYAETLSKRNTKVLGTWGVNGERVIASAAYWRSPLKWNADAEAAGVQARVFCASLADWLEDRRDLDDPRAKLFALIEATPWLEWLLLTKRPQHFEKLTPRNWMTGSAPKNIRVGVTAEDQRRANERLALLMQIPLPNFVSVEPLLGPVNLERIEVVGPGATGTCYLDVLRGRGCSIGGTWPYGRVDWVIVGGESGGDARPMHPDWARALRDACVASGTPYLFKQWGEWAPGECAEFSPRRSELTAARINDAWHFGSLTPNDSRDLHRDDEPDLYRLGKKRAGRLLDGRTWDEFPAARA